MKRALILLAFLCLGQKPYEPLRLPTIATFSRTSGCIYVQQGRDETGRVVVEDTQICGVDFFVVME